MVDFYLGLWAVLPPLLLVLYYYSRIPTTLSLTRLLFFFALGAISGYLALYLEVIFETFANLFASWRIIQRSLFGIVLRQLIEVGPVEEGCKLIAVIVPTYYFNRQYRLRSTTVFLFSIAVALGFTAEESWIYLFHGFEGTTSLIERLISTPVHVMFSGPWGYALANSFGSIQFQNRPLKKQIFKAWLNSVICHALVNILSIIGRYPFPLRLLSYCLFPFLLWMFWRLEQLLRRLQGKDLITLISGRTYKQRCWQRCLMLLALILGGNAIFMLFALARSLRWRSSSQLLYTNDALSSMNYLFLGLLAGLLAWVIYRYLTRLARRRRYF